MTKLNKPLLASALLFTLLCSFSAVAQRLDIQGRIVDSRSGQGVPYATVAVVERSTETILTGTTTGDDGDFELRLDGAEGKYIRINFLGFQEKTVDIPASASGRLDLGTITITEDSQLLEAVEVTGERSRTEFKLDKRVFNVGQDISSSGMNAMEVLNNVPSVNVDIEGEISLRGRAGVQILINGKPSVLTESDNNVLGTITADMIESIEVITNPSAKYDAEGTSGILNIVLKKEEKRGLNGSITVNTGIPDNHNVGVSLNRRTENFNFFTQIGGGYRSMPRDRESSNHNKLTDTTLISLGTSYRNETFFNITLGTDYHISDRDVLTLSGRYAFEDEDQPSNTSFRQLGLGDALISAWEREEETEASNPKWHYDLQYKRDFADYENHDLVFSALGNSFSKEQSSSFLNSDDSGVLERQQTETNFRQNDYTFKLDYTRPFSDRITLEIGGQYQMNDVGNDYEVRNQEDGEWVVDPNQSNNFEYDQSVLAGYATGGFEADKWGLKLGLRAERTDLTTTLVDSEQGNDQVYTDLFPSAHTSYKISERFSLQAGYSKRIYRPRLWHLNPFFNLTDNYNIRRGNPELQPEYTNSYELTGIFIFEKYSFNAGIYHLHTTGVMERVNLFDGNVRTSLPMNIGENHNTGLEVNGKYSPTDKLSFNGDFNYGYYTRTGNFEDENFDFSDDQWTAKLTTRVNLPAAFEVELTGNYRSEQRTVQGIRSDQFYADMGVRKRLWNGRGVINIGVQDLFETRRWEMTIDNPSYASYSWGTRGRYITLGFSYGFGKGDAMTYSGGRR